MDLLPATTYQSPSRLGQGRRLNTILESEEMSNSGKSDSEGNDSDRTIIGRPAGLDSTLFVAANKVKSKPPNETYDPQPYSVESSPVSSAGSGISRYSERFSQRNSLRNSYADSDNGTVFSEDSCPSLTGSNASEATTFFTNSNRSSVASGRTGRKQYPAILIPRDSWASMDSPIKEITLAMSAASKILLSPDVLSRLPQSIPAMNAPPSLGDTSSAASMSPCVPAISSSPPTPDVHDLSPSEGQSWGGGAVNATVHAPQEAHLDGHRNEMLAPVDVHSRASRDSAGYATDWSDLVVHFPAVPGATPIAQTPVTPDVERFKNFKQAPSDRGVLLPSEALSVLQNLTRTFSPVDASEGCMALGADEEMKERAPAPPSRPKSADGVTPTDSDYCFSELTIPSPGGFFGSLQASARHTWCIPKSATTPSSAVAEGFYSMVWNNSPQIRQQVIELPDRPIDSGPSTARQIPISPPTAKRISFNVSDHYNTTTQSDVEDNDLYGSSSPVPVATVKSSQELPCEYDETYDTEIKHAAEVNIDRTSDWLAAQTAYLSALRETNPLNDPADHPATPNPIRSEHCESLISRSEKAAQFLRDASTAVSPRTLGSPGSSNLEREELFLAAFLHYRSQRSKQDAFLQASSRLDSVNANRIALPKLHVLSLLNTHTSESLVGHKRPTYRGPFSLNPRATGIFGRTAEQTLYAEAERKQVAMDRVSLNIWTIEAQQRLLFNNRLLACRDADERLTRKATVPLNSELCHGKKRFRILDLAGASTASWAWAAAQKWPNVRIYTVQTQGQAKLALEGLPTNDNETQSGNKTEERPLKPENPTNHRVISVPQLWQLPFSSNFFDVISARSLHMFLRSKPVPGVESIDEWDMTLKECIRVLKPGGVLDFFLLDSAIATNRADTTHKRNASASSQLSINTSVDSILVSGQQANISPSATVGQAASTTSLPANQTSRGDAVAVEFGFELKRRGYDRDGGCGRLMSRLKKQGFVGVKRQWIGLPMGRAGPPDMDPILDEKGTTNFENSDYVKSPDTYKSSVFSQHTTKGVGGKPRAGSDACDTPAHFSTLFNADGTRKRAQFPLAPRPISEVSTVSRIIEQYTNVEAVQGPVGSTADVADMAGLLGGVMWEEWLVRLRLETGRKEPTKLLEGVNEVLSEGWSKGASWRGVVGWAKKPRASKTSPSKPKSSSKQTYRPAKREVRRRGSTPISLNKAIANPTSGDPGQKRTRPLPFDQLNLTLDTTNLNRGARTAPLARTTEQNRRMYAVMPTHADGSSPDLRSGGSNGSGSTLLDFSAGAFERGEVGTIPMMIME